MCIGEELSWKILLWLNALEYQNVRWYIFDNLCICQAVSIFVTLSLPPGINGPQPTWPRLFLKLFVSRAEVPNWASENLVINLHLLYIAMMNGSVGRWWVDGILFLGLTFICFLLTLHRIHATYTNYAVAWIEQRWKAEWRSVGG